MAVGVGVALANAERQRRSKRQLKRQRRLGLGPRESLVDALPRMALGQLDLAIEQLSSSNAATDAKTVHETRKALKRLRAMLRLLEHQLGKKAYARENRALRDIAQRLSSARDAHVMLATLDQLIARQPRKLGRRRSVRQLRGRLLAEHAQMQQLTLNDPATRAALLAELHTCRERIAAWKLRQHNGIGLVEPDLKRLYQQGRKRYRRVLQGSGEQTIAMHQWRKRVKDLRYAAEILQHRHAPQSLQPLVRRADALSELLGEDHDLAVLSERLRAGARWDGSKTWRTPRKTRKLLLKAIAKRRRKLRKLALRQGAKLYRQSPKPFMQRLRAAHKRSRSQPS
jgi:CHAD domain-containing protein